MNGCLSRARRAGLGWPLPDELDDAQLETLLYPPPSAVATEQCPVPDWAIVHRELGFSGVRPAASGRAAASRCSLDKAPSPRSMRTNSGTAGTGA